MRHMENKNLKGGEKMEYSADMPAQEIWFREPDLELLQKKAITTTIRLGNRQDGVCEAKGCYFPGYFVAAKIVTDPQSKKFADWQADLVIIRNQLKNWQEINDQDLQGSLPGQNSKKKLKEYLEQIYGRHLTDKDLFSIINFEYKDNLATASDLIRVNALSIAQTPEENPDNFDFEHLTIPLIAEDYPAKTPIMWNSAYRQFGIKAGNVMLVGDPAQASHILDVLRKDPKFKGGGAGVGFKGTTIDCLDEIDPLAEAVGSINFILKTETNQLKGYNTDGLGYAMSLEQKGVEIKGKKIVILGAGGTGNAITFALAQKGAHLVILNRTVSKAQSLAEKINAYYGQNLAKAGGEDLIAKQVKDADVIINVSTKGSQGSMEKYNALASANKDWQENQLQAEKVMAKIPKTTIISDIVLTKKATPLLEMAQKQNRPTLDGLGMVINQGVESFWLLYQKELAAKNINKKQVFEVMKKAAGL